MKSADGCDDGLRLPDIRVMADFFKKYSEKFGKSGKKQYLCNGNKKQQ